MFTKAEGELLRKITLEGLEEKGLDTDLGQLVTFYEQYAPTYGAELRLALFGPWIDQDGAEQEGQRLGSS